MTNLAIALNALAEAAAATEALMRARRTYEMFAAEAKRNKELSPEESNKLDADAAVIFASEASQQSGR